MKLWQLHFSSYRVKKKFPQKVKSPKDYSIFFCNLIVRSDGCGEIVFMKKVDEVGFTDLKCMWVKWEKRY